MNNHEEELQQRMTFEDVKVAQKQMRDYLDAKIKNPVVIQADKKILPELIANALLSQPALSGIRPTIELHGVNVPLAQNVYEFLMFLLRAPSYMKQDGKRYVTLILRDKKHECEFRLLWERLYTYCNRLSAGALSEALLRSREKELHSGLDTVEFLGGK